MQSSCTSRSDVPALRTRSTAVSAQLLLQCCCSCDTGHQMTCQPSSLVAIKSHRESEPCRGPDDDRQFRGSHVWGETPGGVHLVLGCAASVMLQREGGPMGAGSLADCRWTGYSALSVSKLLPALGVHHACCAQCFGCISGVLRLHECFGIVSGILEFC